MVNRDFAKVVSFADTDFADVVVAHALSNGTGVGPVNRATIIIPDLSGKTDISFF